MLKKNVIERHIEKISKLVQTLDWSDGLNSLDKEILADQIKVLYAVVSHGSFDMPDALDKLPSSKASDSHGLASSNGTASIPVASTIETVSHFEPVKVTEVVFEPKVTEPIIPSTNGVSIPTVIESPVVETVATVVNTSQSNGHSAEILTETPVQAPEGGWRSSRQLPAPEPKFEPVHVSVPSTHTASSNGYAELYEIPMGKELASHLSNLPVKDLNDALGLNEKVLLMNELFDGVNEKFYHTLEKINQMPDFDSPSNISIRRW
ncbi:MAG: hypothetical protein IPQ04_11075 [Saprospiraceae bacterium]|nr:hypothetical protein [Saprospiraceae bacterium]